MASRSARAAVQTGIERMEIVELPIPDPLPPGCALLRVEANAICGTDHELYTGALGDGPDAAPFVPGHEPVGTIELVADDVDPASGFRVGARVGVSAVVPCGACDRCRRGRPDLCGSYMAYGNTPVDVEHGLWGGLAEHMVLRPGTILHPVPDGLSAARASLFNALAAGIDWVRQSGCAPGDDVVVLGPGQRGLCCVVAARLAGARRVVVTGRTKDATRLQAALDLGADAVVDVDEQDLGAALSEALEGGRPQRILDLTPVTTRPILDAVELVEVGGTVVLAGLKGGNLLDGLATDRVVLGGLTLRGVRSPSREARDAAMSLLAEDRFDAGIVQTHQLGLAEAERAVRLLGGDEEDQGAIQVVVTPNP